MGPPGLSFFEKMSRFLVFDLQVFYIFSVDLTPYVRRKKDQLCLDSFDVECTKQNGGLLDIKPLPVCLFPVLSKDLKGLESFRSNDRVLRVEREEVVFFVLGLSEKISFL